MRTGRPLTRPARSHLRQNSGIPKHFQGVGTTRRLHGDESFRVDGSDGRVFTGTAHRPCGHDDTATFGRRGNHLGVFTNAEEESRRSDVQLGLFEAALEGRSDGGWGIVRRASAEDHSEGCD